MLPIRSHADFISHDVDGELAVFDPATSRYHSLSSTSAFVFGRCDGAHTVDEIARDLSGELGMEEGRDLVELALAQLAGAGLVRQVPAAGAEDSGADTASIARRDAMRRLAAAGVALTLAPMVHSMLAPTPLMAQSTVAKKELEEPCDEDSNPDGCLEKAEKEVDP